MNPLTIL